MILFECEIGYISGANNYNGISIDSLTMTDTKKYLGITTTYDSAFPSSDKTVEQFVNQCELSFGDDFYKFWLMPYYKDGYTNTVWEYGWIPSAKYMYPGLWETVNALSSGSIYPIVVFKKLRKAFTRDRLYEIRNNKFVLYSNKNTPYFGSQSYYIPFIGNYTAGMDLTTATWHMLWATTNTSGTRYSRIRDDTDYINTMKWLLEDNPTPDKEMSNTDPYLPDNMDPSGTGGGTGTFSETGDAIGIPGLPALSAVDTGFITLFNPSAAQVKSLAAYMWSSSFDLATFKNIVANPIDCILGLSIVPVNPPNAGSKAVTVGNIPTDVTLPYLSSQYVEVDCGTLNVQEFWGSYLDYSPYTKMSLYLPYIGIIPLDIDDVMNASIAIKYHVDVLSGACVAYVLCNGTQLYTYVGQCSSNVPITSNDFTNTVNGILGIAGALGKLSADGGASAPTAISEVAANAINALKPNIQKSGAMSGTGGLMGVQTPYLICQRPRQSVPASQNAFTGYPANITAKLSDLSGYTEVDTIHLDGLSATQEEQQEIMDLLTSGVII